MPKGAGMCVHLRVRIEKSEVMGVSEGSAYASEGVIQWESKSDK